MKLPFLVVLLAAALFAPAAEPAQPPGFFELATRWAGRPFAELEAEAERGDSAAQFYLGRSSMIGRGVPRDYERGIALLKRSAEQGNAEAITELARCHYQGQGLPQNMAEALRLARDTASRSNAAGLNLLGFFHSVGAGVPANPAEATRLFQQAAAGGNPVAMRNLGGQHLDGKGGFTRDAAEANRWYLRAAEAGHPGGMVAYGYSLLTGRGIAADKDAAVKWFLCAAAAGESEGLRLMSKDVAADARTVLAAWRQAAQLGDAEAQFHLARLVASGEIVAEGPEETPLRLLSAAAESQHLDAALMLGDRYRWGYGCDRDLVHAARWLLSAGFRKRNTTASHGDDPALGSGIFNWFDDDGAKLKPRLTPDDRALAEAISLYLRALRQRDAEAMRELAGWYRRGYLVPGDLVQTTAWLHLAATTGSAAAAKERDELEAKLSIAQRHEARGRSLQLIIKF